MNARDFFLREYAILFTMVFMRILTILVLFAGVALGVHAQEQSFQNQLASFNLNNSSVQSAPIVVPNDNINNNLLEGDIDDVPWWNLPLLLIHAAVNSGIPAGTVALTLFLPILATLVAFSKNIIGLPTLGTLPIMAAAIALLASNIVLGAVLVSAILLSSVGARLVLRDVKIMQIPKVSLSILMVSFAALAALAFLAGIDMLDVTNISVVPILLFIMLSERVVHLQFDSNPRHAWITMITTLALAVGGYYLMMWDWFIAGILNYPFWLLALIPINIYIGRYFGLRLLERYRFYDLIND